MNREELLKIARPILFNTEMVQAILEGRKTVTRRVIKAPYFVQDNGFCPQIARTAPKGSSLYRELGNMPIPEGPYKINDILYVRETWCNANKDGVEPDYYYYADTFICEDYDRTEWKWRPSIHMPKKAARIFLKVTDVRVEHLKGMKLDDFLREGVTLRPEAFNDPENAYWQARRIFENIWDNTIKKSDLSIYGWDANPYVFVVEFEHLKDV